MKIFDFAFDRLQNDQNTGIVPHSSHSVHGTDPVKSEVIGAFDSQL